MSAKRKATRGPRLKSKVPTRSIATPPIAIAIGPAAPVTTFEIPMYRPLVALGTMSVMSAQSTARNAPAAIPTGSRQITATTMLGAGRLQDAEPPGAGRDWQPRAATAGQGGAALTGRDARDDGGGER